MCKANCDNYFYYQHDAADITKDINIWLSWYETWKTCSGFTKTTWTIWDTDKVYDISKNSCKWDTSGSNKLLGLNGLWVTSWDYEFSLTK